MAKLIAAGCWPWTGGGAGRPLKLGLPPGRLGPQKVMDAGRLSPESTFGDGTKENTAGGNICGTLSPIKADSYLCPVPIWAMGHFSEHMGQWVSHGSYLAWDTGGENGTGMGQGCSIVDSWEVGSGCHGGIVARMCCVRKFGCPNEMLMVSWLAQPVHWESD